MDNPRFSGSGPETGAGNGARIGLISPQGPDPSISGPSDVDKKGKTGLPAHSRNQSDNLLSYHRVHDLSQDQPGH